MFFVSQGTRRKSHVVTAPSSFGSAAIPASRLRTLRRR